MEVAGPDPVDPPGKRMHSARRIDNDKCPPVSSCQDIARIAKLLAEFFATRAGTPYCGYFGLHVVSANAGPLFLPLITQSGGASWAWLAAFATGERSDYGLMAKFLFKSARNLFVDAEIPGISYGAPALNVDPGPHNVNMLPSTLDMGHDDARLALQAKSAFQRLNGKGPLPGS
jgi:hypothetical protein